MTIRPKPIATSSEAASAAGMSQVGLALVRAAPT